MCKGLWFAGVTAFWITMSVADELADRVGIIHQGKVIAVGTVAELRQQSGVEVALEKVFLALTAEGAGENSKFQIPNKLQSSKSQRMLQPLAALGI